MICKGTAPLLEIWPKSGLGSGHREVRVTDLGQKKVQTVSVLLPDSRIESRALRVRQVRELFSAACLRDPERNPALVDDLHAWYLNGGYQARSLLQSQGPRINFPMDVSIWAKWALHAGIIDSSQPAYKAAFKAMTESPDTWNEYYQKVYPRLFWAYSRAELQTLDVGGVPKHVMHEIDNAITARSSCSVPDPNRFWNPHNMLTVHRKAVRPLPGYQLISADYVAAEITTFAYESGDPELIACVSDSNRDLYQELAMDAWKRDDTESRGAAKTSLISFIYGAGDKRIAETAKVGLSEAQAFISIFATKYERATEWMIILTELGKQKGIIETKFGRRMKLPSAHVALNYYLQSTTSDWNRLAFILVQEMLHSLLKDEAIAVAHMHDGFLFHVHKNSAPRALGCINQALSTTLSKELISWNIDLKPRSKVELLNGSWGG